MVKAIAQRGNGSTTLNIGNTSLNMTYGGLLLQWILLLLSTTELVQLQRQPIRFPSGATITTGNDYYVTSWVVNLTPSNITQVGLLNATVKDQIVNPYTVDASKLLVLALIFQMRACWSISKHSLFSTPC